MIQELSNENGYTLPWDFILYPTPMCQYGKKCNGKCYKTLNNHQQLNHGKNLCFIYLCKGKDRSMQEGGPCYDDHLFPWSMYIKLCNNTKKITAKLFAEAIITCYSNNISILMENDNMPIDVLKELRFQLQNNDKYKLPNLLSQLIITNENATPDKVIELVKKKLILN